MEGLPWVECWCSQASPQSYTHMWQVQGECGARLHLKQNMWPQTHSGSQTGSPVTCVPKHMTHILTCLPMSRNECCLVGLKISDDDHLPNLTTRCAQKQLTCTQQSTDKHELPGPLNVLNDDDLSEHMMHMGGMSTTVVQSPTKEAVS